MQMDGVAVYNNQYTWIPSFGLMSNSAAIILWEPEGMVFDGIHGLMTGIVLCSSLAYLVLSSLPKKYPVTNRGP